MTNITISCIPILCILFPLPFPVSVYRVFENGCHEWHSTHDSPLNFNLTLGTIRLAKSGFKAPSWVTSQMQLVTTILQTPVPLGVMHFDEATRSGNCLLCFYTLDSHKTPWHVKTAVRRTITCAIFEYVLYKVVIIQLWLLFLYFLWVCNCKLHWHPSTDYFSSPSPRHPDPSYRPTFSTLLLTLNNLYGSVITWSHSQSRPEFFIGELLSLGARLHEDLQNAYQV